MISTNGLSKCCDAQPYRLNDGLWKCGQCYRDCERYVPQRQDSLEDQVLDVMKLAVRAGCYDAHAWLLRNYFLHDCEHGYQAAGGRYWCPQCETEDTPASAEDR